MSVPYMLAFPAFGSLVSSIPPILVSMAGYILVFAAFLLVITIFFITRNFQLWPGWPPILSSHRTFSSLNRGLAKTLTVMLACLTNISSASLPLQSPGGPGRNRYWHCSNPCRNFCSCATVSFFLFLQNWVFFVQFKIPRKVCNLTLTGQVSTDHLILVKKFVLAKHNVTFYRETANKKNYN